MSDYQPKSKSEAKRIAAMKGEPDPFSKAAESSALVAKKDFVINHNEYHRVIKVGDDLSDVPALYHENLRTEGVL